MLQVEAYEQIRRAYYVDGKSMRQIARELNHSRKTVKKAIARAEPEGYQLKEPREGPQSWVVTKGGSMSCWNRTSGYHASNAGLTVKSIKRSSRKVTRAASPGCMSIYGSNAKPSDGPKSFCRWNSIQEWMGKSIGAKQRSYWPCERVTVQLFVMRLCYSRKIFVMAFPPAETGGLFCRTRGGIPSLWGRAGTASLR